MSLTAAHPAPVVRPVDAFLDAVTRATIHYKVRHLIGRFGFTSSDLADLEQDLALDVWRRSQGYNPERAQWQTFVSRCADHRIADIIRSRCCRMRNYERTSVLDTGDENSPAHGEQRAAHGIWLQDLRLDLAMALTALPEHLRVLCRRLATTSVSEIAAEDGRSRWLVYRDIGRIRREFKAAGLAAYC